MTPEQRKQIAANNLRDVLAELEVEYPAGVPCSVLAAEAEARLDVDRLSVETRLESLQRRDEITEPRADHFLTA